MNFFVTYVLMSVCILPVTIGDHVVKEVQQVVQHSISTDTATGERRVHLINKTIITEHVIIQDSPTPPPSQPVEPPPLDPVPNPGVYHVEGEETEIFNPGERENRNPENEYTIAQSGTRVVGRNTGPEMETGSRNPQTGRRVPWAEERGVAERLQPPPVDGDNRGSNREEKMVDVSHKTQNNNEGGINIPNTYNGPTGPNHRPVNSGTNNQKPIVPIRPESDNESRPKNTGIKIRYDKDGKVYIRPAIHDPRLNSDNPEMINPHEQDPDVILVTPRRGTRKPPIARTNERKKVVEIEDDAPRTRERKMTVLPEKVSDVRPESTSFDEHIQVDRSAFDAIEKARKKSIELEDRYKDYSRSRHMVS